MNDKYGFGWVSRRQLLKSGSLVITSGVMGVMTQSVQPVTAASGEDPVIETLTVSFDEDEPQVLFEYDYSIPSSIVRLVIQIPWLEFTETIGYTVAETENVQTVRSDDYNADEFVWSGGPNPKVTLKKDVKSTAFNSGPAGYLTDQTAFVGIPSTNLPFRYRSSSPPPRRKKTTFDGEGYAGVSLAYAGSHKLSVQKVNDTEVAFVEPDEVKIDIDHEAAMDIFSEGERHLGGIRWNRDKQTNFIIPEHRVGPGSAGRGVGHDSWTGVQRWNLDRIDNVPAHEYAHTVFGTFGLGEMYWLREASAEYYGYLISLNAKRGSFQEFLDTVRTERYANVVLSDVDQMRRGSGDYHKGAHVLAALDAEIRIRTDSQQSLLDVFDQERGSDLTQYNEFEATVTEVAGDESLSEWLNQYVRTPALPEIPEDPEYYTLGDNSPESFITVKENPADENGEKSKQEQTVESPESPTEPGHEKEDESNQTPQPPTNDDHDRKESSYETRLNDQIPGFGILGTVSALSAAIMWKRHDIIDKIRKS
ncbi:hypothetical protein ACLI4Q_06915 [Natrialbaceae archaeon A-CW1-1]